MPPPLASLLRAYARHAPSFAVPARVVRYLHGYYAAHPRAFVTRTRYGFELEGGTADLVQRSVFLRGDWESELSAWLCDRLKPRDVFVDVGANIGYYALLGSRLVGPRGAVVAVEASPSLFRRLASNVRRNRASNVRLVNVAVSERKGSANVFLAPEENLGATSIFRGRDFTDEGRIRANALTEVLSGEEVARARVIKIDVEGAEVLAVRGLIPCLADAREDLELIVEVGGGPRGAPSAASSSGEIIASLEPWGFHTYYLNGHARAAGWGGRSGPRLDRLRESRIERESDLVFSRADAELL